MRFNVTGTGGIKIGPSATLNATFSTLNFDALSTPEADLQATLSQLGQLVLVDLGAPREVRKITLGSGSYGAAYHVELYRVDGDTPTEKPTVSVQMNGNDAELDTNTDFIASRFAVGITNLGTLQPLTVGVVSGVQIRNYPTTPRIGLLDESGLAAPFWNAPGQIGKQAPESDGEATSGEGLSEALTRYFNALPDPVVGPINVALAFESVAPCVLEFASQPPPLSVTFTESLKGFADDAPKKSLRFGDGGSTQTVDIEIPAGTTVVSATVDVAESFPRDREASTGDSPTTSQIFDKKHGLHVGQIEWVGQKVTPTEAMSVSGIGVGCIALVDGTELSIELHEDWNGAPSGKKLLQGTFSLRTSGDPTWSMIRLSNSVALSTGGYWLIVNASKGEALWLTERAEDSVSVFESLTESGHWKKRNTFTGEKAKYYFYSQINDLQSKSPITLSVDGILVEPTTGGAELGGRQNATHYDITKAVSAFLSANPSADATTISIELSANVKGYATVYPPAIIFDK